MSEAMRHLFGRRDIVLDRPVCPAGKMWYNPTANRRDVSGDGGMINARKTTQDILQEEMLRERAAVLARAGEKLTAAMEKLGKIDGEIAEALALWRGGGERSGAISAKSPEACRLAVEINGKIRAYNRQREQVKTRYYYLIVTREALGLIHHERLAELYRLPPRKHCLPEPWPET